MSPIQKPIFRYFFGVMCKFGYGKEDAARWAWGCNHWWWANIEGGVRGRILREFNCPPWVHFSEPGMVDWETVPEYVPGYRDDDRPLSEWTEQYSITAKQLKG